MKSSDFDLRKFFWTDITGEYKRWKVTEMSFTGNSVKAVDDSGEERAFTKEEFESCSMEPKQ